jgi:CheY-like chemotaxis protein
VQTSATELLLEVEDNGCGIPPAQLGRIFDPFYTTKSETLSTGLGLYLCQRFVASFGGSLSVKSEEGRGARFSVLLRPALEKAAPKREPLPPSVHAMRVLIVDDEPLVARSVARMLKDCVSTLAASGPEALSLCSQNEFDMILCDMMMPGMNGSEFFEALRDVRPELAGRVVFMTGGAFTDQTTAFLANHTNPWLQKPVSRDWLLDAAEQLRRESVKLERALRVAREPA